MKTNQEKSYAFFMIVLITIVAIFILQFISTNFHYITEILNTYNIKETIEKYVEGAKYTGALLLILLQALQIVIAFLPGGIVEVISGGVFGLLGGIAISVIGIFAGTCIAFYLAQKLGVPFVKKMVSSAAYERYSKICHNKRFQTITLLLFFLPGIPKDILIYIVGVSNPTRRFTIEMTLIRIPSIIVSVFVGDLFVNGNYQQSIILYFSFFAVGLVGIIINKYILKSADNEK